MIMMMMMIIIIIILIILQHLHIELSNREVPSETILESARNPWTTEVQSRTPNGSLRRSRDPQLVRSALAATFQRTPSFCRLLALRV